MPNAHFQLGTSVLGAARRADGALRLDTSQGPLAVDFVIFSTGFRTDWALRPEFAAFAPQVRLWQDRFAPPEGEADAELAESPDLGPAVRVPAEDAGRLPGAGARALLQLRGLALARRRVPATFRRSPTAPSAWRAASRPACLSEDAELHFAAMQRYAEPELDGDEWTPSTLPPYVEAADREVIR